MVLTVFEGQLEGQLEGQPYMIQADYLCDCEVCVKPLPFCIF